MTWNDLLGTAGVALNQNQAISFDVNCTAGLDTTLLPNQEALLQAFAANATDSEGISIFAPTSVMMSQRSVTIDSKTGEDKIQWETVDESQMVGFHVYRTFDSRQVQASSYNNSESEWIQLTDQPLTALTTGRSAGNEYSSVEIPHPYNTSAPSKDWWLTSGSLMGRFFFGIIIREGALLLSLIEFVNRITRLLNVSAMP